MATTGKVILGKKYSAWFQQTMLRIKNPKISVPFYETHFGMRLAHKYDFPQWNFSLYFLETALPQHSETGPNDAPDTSSITQIQCGLPGTKESENYIWGSHNNTIELTHNYGSENDEHFSVCNGNVEPYRGFGHIAFNTPDVYVASKLLEENGIKFQKKPDEGRMKGLAFVLDPDGYWIEIVQRSPNAPSFWPRYNLSQTMLRVKDPIKSLDFYQNTMGMRLLRESHYSDFSLYFLTSEEENLEDMASLKKSVDPNSGEKASEVVKQLWYPVLELTHNHGTEKETGPVYHNGNIEPQGFGHIGFLVDNLEAMCKEMEEEGRSFHKKPQEGNMNTLAFALDPDGYWVELIQRNSTFL